MKHLITLFLCINSLMSFGNFSFAQPIPDQIDYKKYYTIYAQSKQVSDQKRSAAQQALEQLENSQGALMRVQSEISQNSTTVSNHQTELVKFAKDIQTLQSQNGSMSTTITQNQYQITQNQSAISSLQTQVSRNQSLLQQALGDRSHAEGVHQQATRNSQVLEGREHTAEQERASSVAQVRELEQSVATKQGQIARGQQQVTTLEKELAELQQALPALQTQVQTLQSQTQTLQAQVQQRQGELAPLRAQKQAAQTKKEQDAQARDKLKTQLEQLNASIASAKSQITSLQQSIEQNNRAITTKQQELSNAQSSLSTTQSQLQSASASRDALVKEVADAQSLVSKKTEEKALVMHKISDLRRQLRVLEGGPRPNPGPRPGGPIEPSTISIQDENPQIAAIKKEIEELQAKNVELSNQIAALNIQIGTGNQRLAELKSQIDALNSQVAKFQQIIKNHPAQISALQSQIEGAQSQLGTLSSQLATFEQQRASAAAQLPSVEAQAQASATALQSISQELSQREAALQHLETQASSSAQKLSQAQTALAQKQARLSQANSDLSSVRISLSQLNQELDRAKQSLAIATQTYNQREQVYQQIRRQSDDARAALSIAQRKLENANVVVMNLQDQRRQFDLALQQLLNQNGTLQAANQDFHRQIADNTDRIKYSQEMIVWTNQEILRLNQVNTSLDQQRLSLERSIESEQSTYAQLDQAASHAESATAVKYQEYDVRKKRYDTLLADAVSVGSSAGSQKGQEEGEPKGQQAGLSLGAQEGQIKGMNEGLEYGFAQGKIAGEAKGYEDGHAMGTTSTASYNRGEADGLVMGKADAETEALRVDYVKGKQDQFVKLTSSLPSQMIQLDQGSSLQPNTNPQGQKIFSLKMPAINKINAATCNQSFVDFVNACNSAYKVAYDSAYQVAYQVAYDAAYPGAYETARKSAFEQYKNTRFQEGYKLAYTPAYERGVGAGKQDAYQRGLTLGRKKGYDLNIAAARADAYAKGIQDTNLYFDSHPVLLLKEAKLVRVGLDGTVGGSIGASDLLKLELTVVNYGSKESNAQKIKVEAQALTAQLSIKQTVTQLVSIPAKSVATVSNVLTAKVLETATAGSLEKLSIKFADEDGNITEKTLSAQVQPNLQVKIQRVDYNATPRVGKTQSMKVYLNNFGAFSPNEKMKLGITTDAPLSVFKINTAEVEVYKLPIGSTFIIPGLAYTLLNKDTHGIKNADLRQTRITNCCDSRRCRQSVKDTATDTAIAELASQDYFIWDNFLSPDEVHSILEDYNKLYAMGQFKRAGTGNKSGPRAIHDQIRSDETYWLDPLALTLPQSLFWNKLEALKEKINEQLYLGLWSLDGHYSHYPISGHYQKHLDRFNNDDQRTISMVLYFNATWVKSDGGELRFHFNRQHPLTMDVEPKAGRLVCFLSSKVLHEVLETHTKRLSFAGWWKRR